MRAQYHHRATDRGRLVWNIRRLVRLADGLPVIELPLRDIRELDEPYWYGAEGDTPTVRSIAEHLNLVQAADLRYPILLCDEGRVMDGMHRVVRALLEGRETISAVRFPETPPPDYVDVDLADLPYD